MKECPEIKPVIKQGTQHEKQHKPGVHAGTVQPQQPKEDERGECRMKEHFDQRGGHAALPILREHLDQREAQTVQPSGQQLKQDGLDLHRKQHYLNRRLNSEPRSCPFFPDT